MEAVEDAATSDADVDVIKDTITPAQEVRPIKVYEQT